MIGVDVESLTRTTYHPDIANRFFAPSEAAFLDRLGADQKRSEFIRFWTLKEAFIKGQGKGLSIPLNSFAIILSHDSPPWLSFPASTSCEPAGWQFLQIRLRGAFHIFVAVLIPEPQKLAVRFSTIIPLSGEPTPVCLEPNPLNEWILD